MRSTPWSKPKKADHHHLRYLSEGHPGSGRPADLPFRLGLTVQIEPPELETRVAIVKKKAASISRWATTLHSSSPRTCAPTSASWKALNRVLAYARFHGRRSPSMSPREALKDVIGATNRQITSTWIQKTVADFYKIKVAEMYSHKRRPGSRPTAPIVCGSPANSPPTACRKSAMPSAARTIPPCFTPVAPCSTCATATPNSTTTSTCSYKPSGADEDNMYRSCTDWDNSAKKLPAANPSTTVHWDVASGFSIAFSKRPNLVPGGAEDFSTRKLRALIINGRL